MPFMDFGPPRSETFRQPCIVVPKKKSKKYLCSTWCSKQSGQKFVAYYMESFRKVSIETFMLAKTRLKCGFSRPCRISKTATSQLIQ